MERHLRSMSFKNKKNSAVDPQLWKTLKEWRKKGREMEGLKKLKVGAKREHGGKRGRENNLWVICALAGSFVPFGFHADD